MNRNPISRQALRDTQRNALDALRASQGKNWNEQAGELSRRLGCFRASVDTMLNDLWEQGLIDMTADGRLVVRTEGR